MRVDHRPPRRTPVKGPVRPPLDLKTGITPQTSGFRVSFAGKHMGFTLDKAISELRRAVQAFPIDADWGNGKTCHILRSAILLDSSDRKLRSCNTRLRMTKRKP